MKIPVLRAAALHSKELVRALRECGGFLLEPAKGSALYDRALPAAHEFFALSRAAKASLGIEKSRHFRGWSEMRNERDWREQLHLGRDRESSDSARPYDRLEGPNLWPASSTWRDVMTAYMGAVADLGEVILSAIAEGLDLPSAPFVDVARDGYLVMKLIGYHPQPSAASARPGVAAHVDFSWITLTLQDSPGLDPPDR